ncbi:hypothetical protein HYV57_04680 [Candidatus Peregrinibacteria bacterium]|nr:hypothetical protein [Candidatus Peregrinibacteria bacterium]
MTNEERIIRLNEKEGGGGGDDVMDVNPIPRRTDDVAGRIVAFNRQIAEMNSVPFPGLTPREAQQALLKATSLSQYGYKLGASPQKLADAARKTIDQVQTACECGGLQTRAGGKIDCLQTLESLANGTALTSEDINLINLMRDPRFFLAPKVSMVYLYTKFLPQLLEYCRKSDPEFDPKLDASCVLDDEVLKYLREQDEQFDLSDTVTDWSGFFVELRNSLDGENGVLSDLVKDYGKTEIGEIAPVVNPIQYAMILAAEIVQDDQLGVPKLSFDRNPQTLLSGLDGVLISTGGRALKSCWNGQHEVPSLQMLPANQQTRSLIFRPIVSISRS